MVAPPAVSFLPISGLGQVGSGKDGSANIVDIYVDGIIEKL